MQMQAILATRNQDKLGDVAEQADLIHEIGNKSLVLAATAPPQTTTAAWETQIEALRQQVATLTTEMTSLARNLRNEQTRSRARSR